MEPADLHPAIEAAFNAGDVEAMVAMYEDDAWLFGPEGPVQGLDAIRETWTGFVAMGAKLEMVTQYAVVHGDLAMLSNRWALAVGGEELAGVSSELARRQADGTWKYVIDNPDATGALA